MTTPISPLSTATPEQVRASILELLDLASSGELPRIVQAGHPVLRSQALPFDGQVDDAELAAFLELMRDVMHDAPGVGLAAPQLGIPLQIAVLEDLYEVDPITAATRERSALEYFAILNPAYRPVGEELAGFYEGCLSVNGLQAVVHRHRTVELNWTSPSGQAREETFSGWAARIVQHETDHLAGTLYLDKAVTRSLTFNPEYSTYWAAPDISAAQSGLGFQ